MKCVCDLEAFYEPGQPVRPPCQKFEADKGGVFCDWCEHKQECHEEKEPNE